MRTKRLISSIVSLAIFALCTFGAPPAHAGSTWIDCQPTRLAVYADRIHFQCSGQTYWYGVKINSTNKDFVNRTLSIVNSALTAGKSMKALYVTPDSNGWREVASVEIFQ